MAKLRDRSEVMGQEQPSGLLPEELLQLETLEADGGTDGEAVLSRLQEIWQDHPSNIWDDLPPDLAANFKHYMYGHPKQT